MILMNGVTSVDLMKEQVFSIKEDLVQGQRRNLFLKIWNDFCAQIKTVVKMAKAEMVKEKEEGLLLDGLNKLMF